MENYKKVGQYVIKLNDQLGEGSYGTVYKGFMESDPKQVYAVKVLNLEQYLDEEYKENQQMLMREMDILK